MDVDVLTFYDGSAVIGSVKVGRVTGVGVVVKVVSCMIGIAGSSSTTFPAVGSTELLLTCADRVGVLMDLCAFMSNTSPKIRPIKASNPNSANNSGVQHVLFSLVGGMIGGGTVFGV